MKIHFLGVVTTLLFVVHNLRATDADLSSDRQALLDFAAAVPHQRKLNWNVSVPVCTYWVGIQCNKNGTRVIVVHLPGVGLYGSTPVKSIEKLDALQVLCYSILDTSSILDFLIRYRHNLNPTIIYKTGRIQLDH